MAGVRIRAVDPALANKLVEIHHVGRQTARGAKVYPVRLDDTGAAIVSPTVWARLQEAMGLMPACPRFYAVDDVARPPALTIGGAAEQADVVRFADGHLQPAGQLLVPRISQR
jgi:hypothetical protein